MDKKPEVKSILMYGADWCGDCRRAKMFFEQNKLEFEYIDIDNNEDASHKVIKLNNGNRSIPTIIVELEGQENKILVEPNWEELSNALLN